MSLFRNRTKICNMFCKAMLSLNKKLKIEDKNRNLQYLSTNLVKV